MSLKESGKQILQVVIFIASILLMIAAFKFLTWKGLLGMLIGMFLMAYLLLSENLMVMTIVRMLEGEK